MPETQALAEMIILQGKATLKKKKRKKERIPTVRTKLLRGTYHNEATLNYSK